MLNLTNMMSEICCIIPCFMGLIALTIPPCLQLFRQRRATLLVQEGYQEAQAFNERGL